MINVHVFTAPDPSCNQGATWSTASAFFAQRMKRRFGDRIQVENIEAFTPRSFDFPDVMAAIAGGTPLPIVTVEGRIVTQGGKLSDAAIARAIEPLMVSVGS